MKGPNAPLFSKSNLDLARRCLTLIQEIAERGALSQDPEHVGYALQELSQVLLERTGTEELYFEPVPATELKGIESLHRELDFVNNCSRKMAWKDPNLNHGQWN